MSERVTPRCGSVDPAHVVRRCLPCLAIYTAERRAADPLIKFRKPKFVMTELNRRTTKLFLECRERGGCVPGEEVVMRSFPLGTFELPICVRCGVPIRSRSRATQTTWMNQKDVA
jgi:hypothetical protein